MERTYTLQDMLAALRRRKAVALLVGAAVLVTGVAIALLVPAEYTATSTVQVEPRRLPVDFFPAQGVAPFEERMRTIKHGVLARPLLERVVKETDFFPDLADDPGRGGGAAAPAGRGAARGRGARAARRRSSSWWRCAGGIRRRCARSPSSSRGTTRS